MSIQKNFDFIVIGGSISGVVAAVMLKKRGYFVAIVERRSFIDRKPCGEGLSYPGRKALEQILSINLSENVARELSGYELIFNEDDFNLKSKNTILGIQRKVLDELLRRRCEELKIPIINKSVKSITKLSGGYCLQISDKSISSDKIIVASGIHIPKLVGIKFKEVKQNINRFGFSFHSNMLCDMSSTVKVFVYDGVEFYLTPVSENLCNVAVLGRKEKIKEILANNNLNKYLEKFSLSTPVDEILGAGPFTNVRRKSFDPNLIFIGDSARTLDPIGGMGMTHAVLSAIYGVSKLLKLDVRRKYSLNYTEKSLAGFTNLSKASIVLIERSSFIKNLARTNSAKLLSTYFMNVIFDKIERKVSKLIAVIG